MNIKVNRNFLRIFLGALFFVLFFYLLTSEEKTENQKPDLNDSIINIFLEQPIFEQEIESPLTVKGEARGSWFFEGDFPMVLTDWDGRIIAESYVTAQGDWMTENFIPFEGILEFEIPENIGDFSKKGSFILKKDNPSGLPEKDEALEISIFFK